MWKISSSILLLALLVSVISAAEKWYKNKGIAMLACPIDDDPDDPTVLPYAQDCSKFIKCANGLGYILSCPQGLEWSTLLERCEYKSVAQCSPSQPDVPSLGGGGCSYDYASHPTDCSKLLQCVDGVVHELTCPSGALWDNRLKQCSLGDVQCFSF